MSQRYAVCVFIVSLLLMPSARAITCYVCIDLFTGCYDPFDGSRLLTHDGHYYCTKTKSTTGGITTVARSVIPGSIPGIQIGCSTSSDAGTTDSICYCTTDLCNGGDDFGTSSGGSSGGSDNGGPDGGTGRGDSDGTMKCYSCTECGIPFDGSGTPTDDGVACMKTRSTSGGITTITRTALSGVSSWLPIGCTTSNIGYYVDTAISICYCRTDLCNGGDDFSTGSGGSNGGSDNGGPDGGAGDGDSDGAVQCYSCFDCDDPFNSNGIDIVRGEYCMKHKVSAKGVSSVTRSAAFGTSPSTGCTTTNQNGAEVNICYCATDLCNGAPTFRAGQDMVLVSMVIYLVQLLL